jgi:hypothetical protein
MVWCRWLETLHDLALPPLTSEDRHAMCACERARALRCAPANPLAPPAHLQAGFLLLQDQHDVQVGATTVHKELVEHSITVGVGGRSG